VGISDFSLEKFLAVTVELLDTILQVGIKFEENLE